MIRSIVIITLAFSFSGCALLGDYAQTMHENSRATQEGKTFVHNKGLYAVQVPEDGYYFQEDKNGLVLIPAGMSKHYQGNYFVYTFPKAKVPLEVQNDLRQSFDWINRTFVRRMAKEELDVLMTNPETFHNNPALYVEAFWPEMVKRGFGDMIVIERPAFAYASIVFYHQSHLYWLYRSDPIKADYSYETKVAPNVPEKTKLQLRKLLEGVKLAGEDGIVTGK
jgi:hypothetical protein